MLAALAAAALLAPSVPSGNLLRNPGAEAGGASPSGETTVPIPDWQTAGPFTVVPYGGGGPPDFFTFPPASESDRIGGGKNFFAGGFHGGKTTASQAVDVSRAAPLVDAQLVTASLSGWLGGFLGQTDPGLVEAVFVGATGDAIGSFTIGPVTPDERGRDLKFVQRSGPAAVPPGARRIRVMMIAVEAEGTYDDAYFDNLDLELHGPALTVTRRCLARRRVVVGAVIPHGLIGRSVTFSFGGGTRIDRHPPYRTTFTIRRRTTLLATVAASIRIGGQRAVLGGRLAVHCP